MELFPAIDLKNGQCVRLTQGDFASATIYNADPLAQAQDFATAGAAWLHVVDLDGARDGQSRQLDLIARIARHVALKLQVGGGIRNAAGVEALLASGAARVVIGSLAADQPALVKGWLTRFGPDRIVLAFDVRLDETGEPQVLTHGWQSGSRQSLWDLLTVYSESGLRTVLCTDVSRDGMLTGVNNALYTTMRERWPRLDILASGGVSSLQDLLDLQQQGAAGAIVGKALYEGRFTLAAALAELRQARHAG